MNRHLPDHGSPSAEANRALQENLDRNQTGIFASYALIGAIVLFGGAGFLIDRWAGTSPWFLLLGLGAGMLIGFLQLLARARHS
jgi:F0F1-type ATP synthase assembly protein I